ncbi:MAG: 5'-3' Exoribonuclease of the beta-lactamase fold involved in RNA processing [Candidatus Methanohalarchaeum thermophilum]|uniref:5'-3' Exoribonuclease of the beta-lactamase fold involved in RNA processing n=1 Tax=Methanohalarchaeum thermophilum TaxID=1903181 RepID=A0A1Q6DY07_METT1|nr:MAG: 5'-3' Exoribonuclease of the beta-lactamase fold involved in RNA processing [Candidatus Methanohalarchaeum thermophilum]
MSKDDKQNRDKREIVFLGGVEGVQGSCFYLNAGKRDYLIDCGIKQEQPAESPDFSYLNEKNIKIDGVFLTHAHLDHSGGLPYLEADDYLTEEAKIIATNPTKNLVETLLWDSLKIHKMETKNQGLDQSYGQNDIRSILGRFKGVDYGKYQLNNLDIELGSSTHILGSSWIKITLQGTKITFSGDIGGNHRTNHLKELQNPGETDILVLESTYGDQKNQPSFTEAKNKVYKQIKESLNKNEPVLIPCFAIGRSQEILQLIREREHQLPDTTEIVYDGMISKAMSDYHNYATHSYMNEAIMNYKSNSNDLKPFLPDKAYKPNKMEERHRLLDGEKTPLIVAPSGMLEGGWSPYYLIKMTKNYENAKIILTGHQVTGSVGRKLLEAKREDKNKVKVQVTALMPPEEADELNGKGYGFHEKNIKIPTNWVEQVNGFSGHSAANQLLQFTRKTNPKKIYLTHGEPKTKKQFKTFLEKNLNSKIKIPKLNQKTTIKTKENGKTTINPNKIKKLKTKINNLEQKIQKHEKTLQKLQTKNQKQNKKQK